MTVGEIIALGALIISGLALIRSLSKDSKNSTSELTTVIVKLENIGNDITEIKKDVRSVKAEVKDHGERLAKAEQKIDSIEKLINIYHHVPSIEITPPPEV
jgi:peptidoglycan hydrolase CwlO-like protein